MFFRKRSNEFCCSDMRETLTELPREVEPLVRRDEEAGGNLMMTVGLVMTENGPGYFDRAVMYCPFCGTQLQTPESVMEGANNG